MTGRQNTSKNIGGQNAITCEITYLMALLCFLWCWSMLGKSLSRCLVTWWLLDAENVMLWVFWTIPWWYSRMQDCGTAFPLNPPAQDSPPDLHTRSCLFPVRDLCGRKTFLYVSFFQ